LNSRIGDNQPSVGEESRVPSRSSLSPEVPLLLSEPSSTSIEPIEGSCRKQPKDQGGEGVQPASGKNVERQQL